MTTEELAKMTPEQKRARIAELLGWTLTGDRRGSMIQGRRQGQVGIIPDYLFDLNAMAEADRYAAEHLMDGDQWEKYGRNLELIHPTALLMTGHEIDYYDLATLVTGLTASQRADAFLLTI